MSPDPERPRDSWAVRIIRLGGRIAGDIVFALALFAAALFLASILLARFWPIELLSHFRMQMAVAMLFVSVMLLLTVHRRWSLGLGALTAVAFFPIATLYLPTHQPAGGPEVLRIMSANVLNSNRRFQELQELVQRVDPDVLILEEYTSPWDTNIPAIKERFPYAIIYPREYGLGMAAFSKRPIRNEKESPLGGDFDVPTIFFDLELSGQQVRIAAVHPVSPLSRRRFEIRNSQFRNLARMITDEKRAQVVIGDFNSTTWSPYMRDFLRMSQLRDTRAGFGLQPTWPQFFWPWLIPIDHAFVTAGFRVHRRWVERDIGSDHFPIVVELSLTPQANDLTKLPVVDPK